MLTKSPGTVWQIPGTVRHVTICVSLLLTAGCHKKAAVVRPPLILPAPPPTPVATIPAPAPAPETTPPPVESPIAINPAPLPPPPATTPPKPNPSPRRPVAVAPAPVTPEPVPATPVPAPALGAILSTGERKKLDAEYQSDLRQANKVLNSVRGRALSASQADTVSRVQAFISQAAQYHDRDLSTAAELARRARVLTQDLAGAR